MVNMAHHSNYGRSGLIHQPSAFHRLKLFGQLIFNGFIFQPLQAV